jgi:hypothetical protein
MDKITALKKIDESITEIIDLNSVYYDALNNLRGRKGGLVGESKKILYNKIDRNNLEIDSLNTAKKIILEKIEV